MSVYRFDGYIFDATTGALGRGEHIEKLRPQIAQILAHLLENRDRVVSKEDLIRKVWGEEHVSDQAVFQSMNQLRKALDDNPQMPRYIKTEPRKGYRWVFRDVNETRSLPILGDSGETLSLPGDEGVSSLTPETRLHAESGRLTAGGFRVALGAVAVLVVVVAAYFFFVKRSEPVVSDDENRVAFLPFSNQTGDPEQQWLELGLMDMVVRGFEARSAVDVIPTERVLKALRGQRGDTFDSESAGLFCKRTGAKWLVSVVVEGDAARYQFAVTCYPADGQKPRTKKIEGARLTEITESLVSELGEVLLGKKAPPRPTGAKSDDPFTDETFGRGLQAFYDTKDKEAVPYFEICLQRDADFTWAAYFLAASKHGLGELKDARELIEALIEKVDPSESPVLFAEIKHLQGIIALDEDQFGEAESLLRAALELWRGLGKEEEVGAALSDLAHCLDLGGNPRQARALAGDLRELYKGLQDLLGLAETETLVAVTFLNEGKEEQALPFLQKALEYYEESNFKPGMISIWNMRGYIALEKDNQDEAESAFNQAAQLALTVDAPDLQYEVARNAAAFALTAGDQAEAEQQLQAALKIAEEAGLVREQVEVQLELADLLVEQQLYERACKRLEEGAGLAREHQLRNLRIECLVYLTTLHLDNQDMNAVEYLLKKVRTLQEEKPAPQLQAVLARYLYVQGQRQEAADMHAAIETLWPWYWDDFERDRQALYQRAIREDRYIPVDNK